MPGGTAVISANQQQELAALAGRALTPNELLLGALRNDAALAQSLSVGLTQTISPTRINIGSVLDALGAAPGAAFLDQMGTLGQTASAIKWMLILIQDGTFDIGDPNLVAVINLLVTGGTLGSATIDPNTIAQATATALINLGIFPLVITTLQVSNILSGP
jgi:hypothetical protein